MLSAVTARNRMDDKPDEKPLERPKFQVSPTLFFWGSFVDVRFCQDVFERPSNASAPVRRIYHVENSLNKIGKRSPPGPLLGRPLWRP